MRAQAGVKPPIGGSGISECRGYDRTFFRPFRAKLPSLLRGERAGFRGATKCGSVPERGESSALLDGGKAERSEGWGNCPIVNCPIVKLLEALDGFAVADDLDGVFLSLAAGNQLELGFLTEVLAVEEGGLAPGDVHLLDVVNGEVLGGDGSFGGEAGGKGAHVAQGDAVALEDEFLQAEDGLRENGLDVAVVVGTAVVGDVLGELAEGEVLANLRLPVGLGHGDVGFLGAGLCALDGNRIINHSGPLPTSP